MEDLDIHKLIADDHNFNAGTKNGQVCLAKSFKRHGAGRSILLDRNNRIIAGNKSTQAAIEAGITRVKVIDTAGDEIIAVRRTDVDLDTVKGREMAYLDNQTAHVNLSWNQIELNSISSTLEDFDVSDFGGEIKPVLPPKTYMGMPGKMEPLCDMRDSIGLLKVGDHRCAYSFKTGKTGIPISELKQPVYIKAFAAHAISLIREIIALKNTESTAIITTPKRRHKEQHFASSVSRRIGNKLHIPFYEDAVLAKNRTRVNPKFELTRTIAERNLIIYDDIVTTGSTLTATANLFPEKNVLIIVGIRNHE